MHQVSFRNLPSQLSIFLLAILLTFSTTTYAQTEGTAEAATTTAGGDIDAGKALFNANCASCHKLDKKSVGPALRFVSQKYDRDWLQSWITDSQAMVKAGDPIAVQIFADYNNSVMTAFPQLSETDIDNILAYTNQEKVDPCIANPELCADAQVDTAAEGGVSTNIILGVMIAVLLLLVVMLTLVTKTLKRISDRSDGDYYEEKKSIPIWKAFAKNQFLVFVTSVFLLLAAAYFMFGYFMQLGVDQGYAPVQPIHYSHKIHAGDNQIDCKYCHSSARTSKTSGIPSLNVCMSCHKNISEYNGEVDPAQGLTKEFYDGEIKKLYEAVGWDETEQAYTGEEKPVKWVRIHNLPDFAYFNHSQHVTVGGIECQTCHGPVEEMEVVEQFAPLTMGWCLNCHRETNVNIKDNTYYEKIHEELSKKYGVDKLTVAQMGGLECGKCHY